MERFQVCQNFMIDWECESILSSTCRPFLDTRFSWLLSFPVFYLSFSLTVMSRRNLN